MAELEEEPWKPLFQEWAFSRIVVSPAKQVDAPGGGGGITMEPAHGRIRRETLESALTHVETTLGRIATALQAGKPEDLVRYLRFWGGFHTYSFSNVALLLAQDPHATRVAGFQQWRRVGRHVRRGAKGLAILYPRLGVGDDPETGDRQTRLRGFGVGYVFDVASTEGEPLPSSPSWRDQGPARAGDIQRIQAGIERSGARVVFGREAVEGRFPGADGATFEDDGRLTIAVRDDFDPAHTVHTLLHEFAHAVLHFGRVRSLDRLEREVEADATAAAVAAALGYDFAETTYRYLAQWDATAARLAKALPRIGSATRDILCRLGLESPSGTPAA
jgi:hypothetical protein